MSDQQTVDVVTEDETSENEQLSLLSMEERVDREFLITFGHHGLVTKEGRVDLLAIADLIYPTIEKAIVNVPGDRAGIGITPTHLMEEFFADVPGPDEWAEYDDDEEVEFRKAVYTKVKKEVFRVLSVQPDGPVQSRLDLNGGLVLCRTPKRHGREEMAYVTRNHKCIDEDNNTPAMQKAKAAQARADALAAMAAERVPEHARYFDRRLSASRKEIDDASKNTMRAALEVSTGNGDTDSDES